MNIMELFACGLMAFGLGVLLGHMANRQWQRHLIAVFIVSGMIFIAFKSDVTVSDQYYLANIVAAILNLMLIVSGPYLSCLDRVGYRRFISESRGGCLKNFLKGHLARIFSSKIIDIIIASIMIIITAGGAYTFISGPQNTAHNQDSEQIKQHVLERNQAYTFKADETYVTGSLVNFDGSLERARKCFLVAGSTIREVENLGEKKGSLYSVYNDMQIHVDEDGFSDAVPESLCEIGAFYMIAESGIVNDLVARDSSDARDRQKLLDTINADKKSSERTRNANSVVNASKFLMDVELQNNHGLYKMEMPFVNSKELLPATNFVYATHMVVRPFEIVKISYINDDSVIVSGYRKDDPDSVFLVQHTLGSVGVYNLDIGYLHIATMVE